MSSRPSKQQQHQGELKMISLVARFGGADRGQKDDTKTRRRHEAALRPTDRPAGPPT
jgi:hypothetical protein